MHRFLGVWKGCRGRWSPGFRNQEGLEVSGADIAVGNTALVERVPYAQILLEVGLTSSTEGDRALLPGSLSKVEKKGYSLYVQGSGASPSGDFANTLREVIAAVQLREPPAVETESREERRARHLESFGGLRLLQPLVPALSSSPSMWRSGRRRPSSL